MNNPNPEATAPSTPAAAVTATPAPAAAAPAAAAPAAEQPASPTLRGFLQSIRTGAQTGAELITARQQIATLTTERDQARADLTTANVRADQALAQANAFAAFFGLAAADFAGKSVAEVNALITQKISDQAVEKVAAMGVPVNQLPTATKTDTPSSAADLVKQYNALTDADARADFYAKHRDQMFGNN